MALRGTWIAAVREMVHGTSSATAADSRSESGKQPRLCSYPHYLLNNNAHRILLSADYHYGINKTIWVGGCVPGKGGGPELNSDADPGRLLWAVEVSS